MLFFITNANSTETIRIHEGSSPIKKISETVTNLISESSKKPMLDFSLTSFTLVDSETDEDLFILTEGLRIDMASIIGRKLNIRVNTQGDISNVFVRLSLGGPIDEYRRENFAPFAVFGDINGDYAGKELPEGDYSISANADNPLLNEFTGIGISFTIVGFPRITGVVATMNLNSNFPTELLNVSFPIEDGTIYDRSQQTTLPSIPPFTFKSALIAQPNNGVGSVGFQLSGPLTINRTENVPPYSLFGDINGNLNYSNGPFPTGTYTLVVTPYSEPSLKGSRGEELTITFTIIDDAIVKPKILDLVYSVGGDGGPFDSVVSIMVPTAPVMLYNLSAIIALGNPVTNSVEMALTSKNGFQHSTVENLGPYGFSLFGPSWTPPSLLPGTYYISMTPYSEMDKQGVAGETVTIHLQFGIKSLDIIGFEYSSELYNFETFFPLEDRDLFYYFDSERPFAVPVTIRANTYLPEVGSVKLEIKNEYLGFSYSRIENDDPYTLFGDDGSGGFDARLLANEDFPYPIGYYELTATAFSEPNGKGTAGVPHTISFNIFRELDTESPEIRFIEAESASLITTLSTIEKTVIDQSVTPTDNVNFVAEYVNCGRPEFCPQSVLFTLTGAVTKTTIESNEPFSLFGDYDSTGTFIGESLPVGEYTLIAQGYSEDGAKGFKEGLGKYNFQIINSNALLSKAKNTVLYPNPASNTTFVKTEDRTAIFKTVILDVTGKKVKEYNGSVDSEQAIDVSGLKKGLYIVQIYTGNERVTKKLVVQ